MSNVLLDMIETQAAKTPGAPAMIEAGRRAATYGDLIDLTRRHIATVSQLNFTRPLRIATLLPASANTGVFILACCCAATAMPINPALSDAEVTELARDGGATHLAGDRDTIDRVRAIASELGIEPIELVRDDEGPVGSAIAFANLADPEGAGSTLTDIGKRDASETALVLFTSGSTDRPKRVPLSLGNLVAGSHNVAGSVGLGSSDIALSMMPMVHVGGLVDMFTAVFASGGAVAFAGQASADNFFSALLAFRPTWFQAVPAVLSEIQRRGTNEKEAEAIRGLRFIRAVAQPLLNGQHLAFEERFGVPLVPMYGMTEATGVIASPMPGSPIAPGTVGRPFGPEVAIVDAYGNPAATGAIGEVLIAGASVTSGYEGHDRASWTRGRWLRTGDQGFLDAEGVLTLGGRIKELINKGGEKISPLEIERAATLHPAVAEVAAFALPHPSLGEDVALAVVAYPGQALDLTTIQSFLRPRLAEYKLPRSLLLVDRLPRVPNGKLDRRALPGLAIASSPRSLKTPPTTETEKALATLWADVLDGQKPCLEDDFFELGGDSLSATNLATLIEKRFRGVTATGDLFLAPTLVEMARRLDTATTAAGADRLRRDLEAALRKAMVSWPGSRQAGSVAITRNALGEKTPFFWICQSRWQFELLTEHLSSDRPVHILSSLSNTGLKTDANTVELAKHYARWIVSQVPAGQIHLGGFCQGGLVAFHVAEELHAMGRRPDVLCIQDRFIPRPYAGAVALFSGRRGFNSLYDRFAEPEPGWAGYYSGAVSFHPIDADHDDLHKEPHVATFSGRLEAVLDAVAQGREMPGLVGLSPRAPLDPAVRDAVVEAKIPLFMRPGAVRRLAVRVRNLSNVSIEPTRSSGVSVAAEWRSFDPLENYEPAGRAVLGDTLPPGAEVDIAIDVRMPVRGLPVRLTVDLVEDGVSWFNEHRPARAHRLVFPLPAL